MFRKTVILFGLIFLLLGCKKEIKPNELAEGVQPSQLYYTQFSLFQEKDNFRTTNYRKGTLIPINTRVSLVSINSGEAELRLVDTGQKLTIENVPKITKDDMQTAFKKIAGATEVDLNQFTKEERTNILTGKAQKGMSKNAVLAAMGYPPQHETPSLDGDMWTYWSNRFNKLVVNFKNGKVESIVD